MDRMKKSKISHLLGNNLKRIYEKASFDESFVQEIRIRINSPFLVMYKGEEWILDRDGKRTSLPECGYMVQPKDIKDTLAFVSDYSVYAFEEELGQGYLTVEGGHRVGVAGKVITHGNGSRKSSFTESIIAGVNTLGGVWENGDRNNVGTTIKGMKYITYINIRIAHQVKGCASKILPYLIEDGQVFHTLIISAPCCGKTTILRDLIRQISMGTVDFPGCSVGVVDERSEIGGSYMGIPQNDLGPRTDLLDACPKAEGMMMLIRSMAPSVLAVDELGSYGDIYAIESVIHCGCKLLATVHGASLEDIRRKPLFEALMKEHIFQRYIVLHNRERISEIKYVYDEKGNILLKNQ